MHRKYFFRRHGPPWARERWEFHIDEPRHHHGVHRHGPFWHGGPPPPESWPRPPWHEEDELWFAPERPRRFGRPWGRGGPFGDDPFGEGGGRRRQRRGDIKFALLELLAEQPRHGYELIKELERRYGGFYRPSPGSVYPTLQLLEDEGHLTSDTVEGKRVYTITESGRQLLAERHERAEPEGEGPWHHGPRAGAERPDLGELRESSMALVSGVMQAARHGTPEQVRAAIALLDSTRRELYRILAAEREKQGEG